MVKRCLVIVLVLLAVIGCRPRNVLSNKEMRDVLYDLHRVDGALQVAGYTYGHNQELSAYYKTALDKHGVTQAQFDSSLVWFTDNPQIFNKIYPKVIERLQMDVDRETALRDERIAKNKLDKDTSLQNQCPSVQATRPQRPLEEVQEEYMFGVEIPWKVWVAEEFCEKSVIIFGQLEKK